MNKPLVRWTVGPCIDTGLETLRLSVANMKKLYKDKLRYVICHNGLSPKQIKLLPNIPLVDQTDYANSLSIPPPKHKGGPAWKLYPPRLDITSHEIILDNDVVLHSKPPLLDEFFSQNDLIVVTEAIKRSYSEPLENLVPQGFHINSGVLCFPPNFDFKANLEKSLPKQWDNHFDEQTLVAYVLSRTNTKVKIIPLSEIFVCANEFRPATHGFHFVGINEGNTSFWSEYKTKSFGSQKLLL